MASGSAAGVAAAPLPDEVEHHGQRGDRHDRDERLGSVPQRVDREEREDDGRRRDPCEHDHGVRARVRAPAVGGDADEEEDHERAGASHRRDRGEVDEVADDEHDRGRDQHAGVRAEPRGRPEERRKLAGAREHLRQAARGIERRVHGRRGREQGRDRHHREAGVPERRPRGLGDRGLAVADHLRDGERAEDAERDQDVQHRRHAERRVHRLRQLARRVAQVARGEGDHAEAEVGEEGEGDARDDVVERRIAAEGEQVEVDVRQRDDDEDGEDREEEDDDQRLRAVDDLGADDVDARHREHDQRREHVVPARRRALTDEEGRGVAPERDGDHRADDHDRGEVAQPGGDPDEPSVAEPLDQVRDDPARRGEADAHLDDGVAEQRGDDPGEEEREPDGRPRDRSGLAEQREDAGADHGADAEEGGAADAHATGR